MTMVEKLTGFVEKSSYDRLSSEACQQIKIRVLDSLGCALGALDAGPIRMIRDQIDAFGGSPLCTLIGGGRTALTGQPFTIAPWFATLISTTPISQKARPATRATVWARFFQPRNTRTVKRHWT